MKRIKRREWRPQNDKLHFNRIHLYNLCRRNGVWLLLGMDGTGGGLMPKYIPTTEDLFIAKPCVICGTDVIDENSDTCCFECATMKQSYDEDLEYLLMESED